MGSTQVPVFDPQKLLDVILLPLVGGNDPYSVHFDPSLEDQELENLNDLLSLYPIEEGVALLWSDFVTLHVHEYRGNTVLVRKQSNYTS